MKTIKVCWTEREVIEYSYEEDFEVEDDFVANSESVLDLINENSHLFDNNNTHYTKIGGFVKDGILVIPDMEIDSYEEILPPSPEDRKAEYLELLSEMEKKIAGMVMEKERILKLVNE